MKLQTCQLLFYWLELRTHFEGPQKEALTTGEYDLARMVAEGVEGKLHADMKPLTTIGEF